MTHDAFYFKNFNMGLQKSYNSRNNFMRKRTTKYNMAATSTSSSVSSSNVANHYGVNSQSMSAPSAVTVQVLSSSPATPIVSRGGSVNNGKVV